MRSAAEKADKPVVYGIQKWEEGNFLEKSYASFLQETSICSLNCLFIICILEYFLLNNLRFLLISPQIIDLLSEPAFEDDGIGCRKGTDRV